MSKPKATLRDVLSALSAEQLLQDGDAALAYLKGRTALQP